MEQANPLADRRVRSLMGLFSASIVVAVALLFVDGTVRWIMLGVAAVDLVMTPYILGLAAEQSQQDEETEHSGFEN